MSASLSYALRIVCLILAGPAEPPDQDGDGVPDAIDVCSNTPAGMIVDAVGRPLGDFDGDCDVDQRDFAVFAANYTGVCLAEICDGLDNDCDGTPDNEAFSIDVEDCADGEDNDCDDLIDCEDFAICPMGTACGSGHRACNAFHDCGCADGFDDCNNSAVDGCETNLRTDVNHCLACDHRCVFNHANASCNNGSCVMGSCISPYANCDGLVQNGCEANLQSASDCGACGAECPYIGAGYPACLNGTCIIGACWSNHADCDGLYATGCEFDLAEVHGECGGAIPFGTICGDEADSPVSKSAVGNRWEAVRVDECDLGISRSTIGITVTLQSVPNGYYGMDVYAPCGTLLGSAEGHMSDELSFNWPDSPHLDDSRYIAIHVRMYGFASESCEPWTLTVRTNAN